MHKPILNSKKILEPKYAVAFVLRFFTAIFIGIGVFSLLLVVLLNRKIGPTYSEGISALGDLQNHLPLILFVTSVLQTLALGIMVMVIALFWSHSIAGPILRFKKYLSQLAKGELLEGPVTFRKTDQLQGLAEALSGMITAYRGNSMESLELLSQAQKIIEECEILKKQPKIDTPHLNTKLSELEKIYLNIKTIYTCRKPG